MWTGTPGSAARLQRGAMTFAIHASKDGQSVLTIRINPAAVVDKARLLESLGWQVHITDAAGRQFGALDLDRFFASTGKVRDETTTIREGPIHVNRTN